MEDDYQDRNTRLKEIMKEYGFTAKLIGLIIKRSPGTVLNYTGHQYCISEKNLTLVEGAVNALLCGSAQPAD